MPLNIERLIQPYDCELYSYFTRSITCTVILSFCTLRSSMFKTKSNVIADKVNEILSNSITVSSPTIAIHPTLLQLHPPLSVSLFKQLIVREVYLPLSLYVHSFPCWVAESLAGVFVLKVSGVNSCLLQPHLLDLLLAVNWLPQHLPPLSLLQLQSQLSQRKQCLIKTTFD